MKKFWRKLKDEKGEVSVEWVLVAVVMGGIILATFMPQVSTALGGGITTISEIIAGAYTP